MMIAANAMPLPIEPDEPRSCGWVVVSILSGRPERALRKFIWMRTD
jgi:hypothetical protein